MVASSSFIFKCLVAIALSKSAQNAKTLSPVEEVERYIDTKKPEINQRYRPIYHVAGPVGWINDPNGFSFYNGEYHLFYQFYPYDSVWGPMHWGHVSSPDLVNWKQLPTALVPEKEQCFSGSAIQVEDTMVLMYTAHVVSDNNPVANQTQYLAYSNDGVTFTKYEGNPVIPIAPNASPDFRDPKVWKHEDHFYVILGSKTSDERGRVLLYRSTNLVDWEFLKVLAESTGELGYMWECPDFFELDGKFILLMSPQGVTPQGDRYKNVYQNGYIIGSFNYENFTFIPEIGFQEIDYGHDFYAAQTTEVNGKRYLVSWFNMWEVPHPEDVDGWAGAMTIIRELKLEGNRILMKPVDAMVNLRNSTMDYENFGQNQQVDLFKATELIINGDLTQNIELLIEGQNGGEKVWLRWNLENKKVVVDRGSDDIRQVEWSPIGSTTWRIFLDASSLELFCGEGEVVFSSRVYPDGGWRLTNLSPQSLSVKTFSLNRSVPV